MPGYQFANWELGYGDVHLVPDLATLRIASWLDKTALVLCDVAQREDRGRRRGRAALDPAHAARRARGRWARSRWPPSELEYYLFRDSFRDAAQQGLPRPRAGRLVPRGLPRAAGHPRRVLQRRGAAAPRSARASRSRTRRASGASGQHELNVRYADALEMADRHVVFKQCLKEIADRLGRERHVHGEVRGRQAGSSCHIHMSLWREAAKRVRRTARARRRPCSDTFRTSSAAGSRTCPT